MSNNKNILILNTGGTFNKVYNEIDGKLEVPRNNKAIENILESAKIINYNLKGLLYKDSLEINDNDRKELQNVIEKSKYKKILIIHGTDTMDKTAKYLSKHLKNKTVILTGAMVPFSIDSIEATSNFMLALGALSMKKEDNIYIAMHGNIKQYTKIKKNRDLGVFECQK